MGSLRMYRSGDDAPLRRFPDGCFIRTYRDTHDILPWAEICRAGQLLSPDGDAGTDFRNVMLHHPGLHCYRDLFFVVRRTDRQLLATIAAIASTDDQNRRQGYLHMVAARPETRGRHIGSAMIAYALRKLFLDRVEYTILDTDDFRLPAVLFQNVETHRSFHSVEVVVDARLAHHEQRRGNAFETEVSDKVALESVFDELDCLFGFAYAHSGIVIFGKDKVVHILSFFGKF